MQSEQIKIVFQHFNGCPNGPTLLERVKTAITRTYRERVVLKEIIIDTPEKAEHHGFRGSPTLLINGKDFEGLPVPVLLLLACRTYLNGLPTVEDILEKIVSE